MNRKQILLPIIILAAASSAYCAASAPVIGQIGDPAPGLESLQWVKGEPVGFRSGHVYVVEFWATWCPPCKTTIPHLSRLQKRFQNDKVTIIGITNEREDTITPFLKRVGEQMVYTVALDTDKSVSNAYLAPFKITSIPHAFVVDGHGRIAWHGNPLGDLEGVLERIVAGDFNPAAYARQLAVIEANRKQADLLYRTYFEKLRRGGPQPARETGVEFLYAATPALLNRLVWEVLTASERTWRDIPLMVRMSARANLLTDSSNSAYLDTYAYSLFLSNHIYEAIRYEKKAIELALEDTRRLPSLRKMLDEYMQVFQSQGKKTIVTKPAPKWNVIDWANLPIGKTSLEPTDFKGKVTYVCFFQSTCPACKSHGLPVFKKVINQYATDKNVAFVAIQTVFEKESTNTLAGGLHMLKSMGIKVPCGRIQGKPVPDIMRRYAARGTPWTIIMDQAGNARYSDFLIEPEQAQLVIDELLKPKTKP